VSPFDDTAYVVGAIVGLTLVTVATRSSFFMLPQRFQLPPLLERALRFAPACALAAIVAPSVFTRDHHVYLSVHNNQMWAVLAAGAVFTWKRNMLLMMTVGMAVFTALRLWA
jgi:branched-subunit amino acid transport protein